VKSLAMSLVLVVRSLVTVMNRWWKSAHCRKLASHLWYLLKIRNNMCTIPESNIKTQRSRVRSHQSITHHPRRSGGQSLSIDDDIAPATSSATSLNE